MRVNKSNIIYIIGCAVILSCFVVMIIAGSVDRKHTKCCGLEVVITDSTTNRFVNKKQIQGIIDSQYGKYIDESIDSINLTKIEEIIDKNSAVFKSQVYIGKDGILRVDIIQRKPVVRFITSDGGYYADAEGKIIPLQKNFSSRVYVVDGKIPIPPTAEGAAQMNNPEQLKWFKGVISLASYLENNEFWKSKFVQFHCLENQELALIPRIGNERFIIGQPDKIEEKLERISLYYTNIVPEKGENYYKEINVAFEGQIVCK